MSSLLQYAYTSKLFTLRADAQYLLKTFRKKIRFAETLNEVLKQHRKQYHKIAKNFVLYSLNVR